MRDLTDRLIAFIKYCGLTQREFEKRCGVNHTDLNRKVQGPTAQYMMKICTAFPQLDMNWLFTGDGEMVKDGQQQVVPAKEYAACPQPERTLQDPFLQITQTNSGGNNTVNIGNVGEFRDLFRDVVKEIMNGR